MGMVLGLLSGLASGICLVVMQDRMNPSIELPGEAAFYMGIPELGSIPSWSIGRKTGASQRYPRLAMFRRAAIAGETRNSVSHSAVAETFRLLLTSILFIGRRRPVKVLVVTSPGPSEGKSTVVSNLAVAFAETGRTVLVIDSDMARPHQHEILAVPNQFGLASVLAEGEPLEARSLMLATHSTEIPGVSVMPFGDPDGGGREPAAFQTSSRVDCACP